MDFSNIDKIFKIQDTNQLRYQPVKVVHKNVTPDLKKIVTQSIFVFVGYIEDKKVVTVLDKMEKNPKLLPNKQESTILKKHFGVKFRELLHLTKPRRELKVGGGNVDILTQEDESDRDLDLDLDLDKELASSVSSEPKKKVKEKQVVRLPLRFIYEYINIDDEIDIIRHKIELAMSIPIAYQHNWYHVRNFNYQCRIITDYVTGLGDSFPINIKDFMKSGKEEILGVNIDAEFIRQYKQKSQLYILNTTNYIIGDTGAYPDFKGTIDVLSIFDVLNTIGFGKIQSLQKNDNTKYERFYYGFVMKYWPMIKINELGSIVSQGQIVNINSNRKIYTRLFRDQQYYINLIHNIPPKDIDAVLETHSGITSFDFSINKKFSNLFKQNILKLEDIYHSFQVNVSIPYVSYYRHGIQKPLQKIHTENESEFFLEQQILKWKDNTTAGLIFKIRMVLDRSCPLFDTSYMTVGINGRGKISVKTTWKEGYSQKIFDNVNLTTFYTVVNNLIKKINKKSPRSSFIKNIKIPEIDPNYKNVTFQFINFFTRLKIKKSGASLNYKIMQVLIKVFKYYVRIYSSKRQRRRKTMNEAKIGYIRKSKYRKFPKSKLLNQFWLDQGKIMTKPIYTYISEAIRNEPKIAIRGIKDFNEFKMVYNFIIRLVYIALDIKTFLNKPGMSKLKEEYRKMTLLEKDIVYPKKYIETYYASKKRELSEGVKKNTVDPKTGEILTQFKKIQLLKSYNPKLFGYKKTDKYESYSRLCQNEKQPYPMTDKELEKFKKTGQPYVAVKYPVSGDDTKVQPVNYVCTHSLYKYPGFISPDKHPNNHCLPCCFINDSVSNPRSKNAKTYDMCIGKQAKSADESEEISQKYIKQYTKFIVDGRLSNPPNQLNRFLNETKVGKNDIIEFKGERRRRRSIYQSDTQQHVSTYLLLGIPQHNRSYVTAIETALDIQRGQLIPTLIKQLQKKSSKIFSTLSNGNIQRKFGTVEGFIQYLQNPGVNLEPAMVTDLIVRLNPVHPGKLCIHLLREVYKQHKEEITLVCNNDIATKFSPGTFHVVVFNTGRYYYPIVLVGSIPDSDKIVKIFTLKAHHKIVLILRDLLAKMCDKPAHKISGKLDESKANLNITAKQLYDLLINKIGVQKSQIKRQLVNSKNYVIGLIIQGKKSLFTIPVLLSDPMPEIPLTHTYSYGEWNDVYPFLQKLGGSESVISKLIVDSKKQKIVGVVIRYKMDMNIKPIPIKSVKMDSVLSKLKFKVQVFNPKIVNGMIQKNIVLKDDRITQVPEIRYHHELYNLVKFEMNNELFQERNQKVRQKLLELYKKYPGKDMLFHLNEIEPIHLESSDFMKLKELLRVVSYFSKTKNNLEVFKKYFVRYTFHFDLITIRQIEDILESEQIAIKKKKSMITNIVQKILKKVIKITKTKKNTNVKITTPCSDIKNDQKHCYGYCVWSNDGGCHVIVPSQHEYNNILSRMINELVNNISARDELLKVKLSWQT